MLNLPIFQKNRSLIPNPSLSSCSGSRNKPINVKKAEFEKKIRKFIEQNSPDNKESERVVNSLKPSFNILKQSNQNNMNINRQGILGMNLQSESIGQLKEMINNDNLKKKEVDLVPSKIVSNRQVV